MALRPPSCATNHISDFSPLLCVVLYLVGNKSDLSSLRQVPRQKAVEFARDVGAYFVEISARDNTGVEQLFAEIASGVVHQNQIADDTPPTISIGWSNFPISEEKKKDTCC